MQYVTVSQNVARDVLGVKWGGTRLSEFLPHIMYLRKVEGAACGAVWSREALCRVSRIRAHIKECEKSKHAKGHVHASTQQTRYVWRSQVLHMGNRGVEKERWDFP